MSAHMELSKGVSFPWRHECEYEQFYLVEAECVTWCNLIHTCGNMLILRRHYRGLINLISFTHGSTM